MPDVNTPVAEPSAAATQFDGWDPKGNPIVTKQEAKAETKEVTPKTQDSAPAEKDKSEAKAESAAEAETATTSQEKPHKPKPDAEARIRALLAENKQLKAAQAKPETKTEAESSTAKPEAKPEEAKAPVKPKLDDKNPDGSAKFKTYEEFDEAKDSYYEALAEYKAEKKAEEAVARDRQRQAQEAGMKEFMQKVSEAAERYDDWDVEKINSAADTIAKDQNIPLFVKQRLGRSTVLPDLMYTLTGDQKDFDSLLELAKADPLAAIDKIVLTENLVKEELKSGKRKAKAEAKAEPETESKGKAKEETPETKPRAPKPPSEVGGRGTAAEDSSVAAARANDFRAFEASEKAKFLQRATRS